MLALTLPAAAVLLFLLARAVLLRRALARVPVRIHVGGTRGKTTVCRLIAAGLRSSGVRTLAKTTGTEPMLILPDGSTQAWRRSGPPSIGEQRRFAVLASCLGAQATVLECMAIRADFVRASERSLVRATVAVLTNIRPDHLEDLASMQAVAASHLGLVPENGVLVAAEEALSQTLRELAVARGTRIVAVPTSGLTADEANRAIALAACEAAGVSARMPRIDPDPGSFSLTAIHACGKKIRFANAFACNDAVSLGLLWREHAAGNAAVAVLLNHRHDRPLRSLQILDFFAQLPARPRVLLLGGPFWLRHAARKRGLEVQSVSGLPWAAGRKLLERVAALVPDGATVWGVGNYHGRGAAICQTVSSGALCSS
jgi:poly-gamma-glutamate synthase PgsB/CapB